MTTKTAPRNGKRRQATAAQIEAAQQKANRARELGQQLLTDPAQVANLLRAMLTHNSSARILGYSLSNQAQLFAQAEDAGVILTDVAGYSEWKERGRQVRKGATGFRIWSYRGDGTTKADREAAQQADDSNGDTPRARRFGVATVFDISHTDPIDGAEQAEADLVDNPADVLYASLVDQFERRGYTVTSTGDAADTLHTVNVDPDLNTIDASLFLARELADVITQPKADRPEPVAVADAENAENAENVDATQPQPTQPQPPVTPNGTKAVSESVRAILATAEVDGTCLRIPGQLARADYEAVNKVLDALGGKWNRKAKGHVFPSDPSEALAAVLDTGKAPGHARTVEGYVATPAELATEVVELHTDIAALPHGARVLEPSAGDGALVRAILEANPDVSVTAVEPNATRASLIGADPRVTVVTDTLEAFTADTTARYDLVVMNPPFAMPGQPTAWIDHVSMAWELLAPGGRLVAIVPAGFVSRIDRRHAAMRDLVSSHGGYSELSPDAFTTSGTSVRTVVVWLDREPATQVAA